MSVKNPPSTKDILALLDRELPPFFLRKDIEQVTHGLFSSSTIASMTSRGKGPAVKYLGKRCVIEKKDFLDWVEQTYFTGENHGDIDGDGDVPEESAGEPGESGKAGEGHQGD